MTSAALEGVRTAKVNGTTLAYRERGEGQPVVFVHGAISDWRTWEQQLPEIGRAYRAITYSRRYARPNEDIAPDAEDPWERHAEDLAAFLREIDAAPAHLVGNSQGGFISLITAVRFPEVVRSLVIEEAPVLSLFGLSSPPTVGELLNLVLTRPAAAIPLLGLMVRTMGGAEKAFRRGDDEDAMRIFGRGVLGADAYRNLSESRRTQVRENLSTIRAALLGVGLPTLEVEEAQGISAPALLVTGERSPRSIRLVSDRLGELLPNARRVEIPSAGHLMHEDNAPGTNEAILEFLGRLHRRS